MCQDPRNALTPGHRHLTFLASFSESSFFSSLSPSPSDFFVLSSLELSFSDYGKRPPLGMSNLPFHLYQRAPTPTAEATGSFSPPLPEHSPALVAPLDPEAALEARRSDLLAVFLLLVLVVRFTLPVPKACSSPSFLFLARLPRLSCLFLLLLLLQDAEIILCASFHLNHSYQQREEFTTPGPWLLSTRVCLVPRYTHPKCLPPLQIHTPASSILTMASALSMSRRRLSNQPVSMRDRKTLRRFCRPPRASCRRFPTSSGWYLDRNLGTKRGRERQNNYWKPKPGCGKGPRKDRA